MKIQNIACVVHINSKYVVLKIKIHLLISLDSSGQTKLFNLNLDRNLTLYKYMLTYGNIYERKYKYRA